MSDAHPKLAFIMLFNCPYVKLFSNYGTYFLHLYILQTTTRLFASYVASSGPEQVGGKAARSALLGARATGACVLSAYGSIASGSRW